MIPRISLITTEKNLVTKASILKSQEDADVEDISLCSNNTTHTTNIFFKSGEKTGLFL